MYDFVDYAASSVIVLYQNGVNLLRPFSSNYLPSKILVPWTQSYFCLKYISFLEYFTLVHPRENLFSGVGRASKLVEQQCLVEACKITKLNTFFNFFFDKLKIINILSHLVNFISLFRSVPLNILLYL